MKKIVLLVISCFLLSLSGFSQDFSSAVGLRLGYPLSASYKTFLNETNAVEGYVGFRNFSGASFVGISGAYQIHKDIESVDNLQWYYGGGASVFLWSVVDADGAISIGLQGYVGLSYTLADTPVNFSVDWIPTVFINGLDGYGTGFGGGYGTLAVRYVLSRG